MSWGPSTWVSLHTMSFSTTDDCFDAESAASHLRALVDVLPCLECRDHMRRYLNRKPPEAIDSLEAYQRYLVRLHNAVNRRLGKAVVSFAEASRLYADASCCTVKPVRRPGTVTTVVSGATVLAMAVVVVLHFKQSPAPKFKVI